MDGVNGRAGRYVQLHVVTELKNVNARAQNRAQNLVGKIVMVSVGKPRHVKQYHAQVSLYEWSHKLLSCNKNFFQVRNIRHNVSF